jgi:hypothetical protein
MPFDKGRVFNEEGQLSSSGLRKIAEQASGPVNYPANGSGYQSQQTYNYLPAAQVQTPPPPQTTSILTARVLGSDTTLAEPCGLTDTVLYPYRLASFVGPPVYVLIDSEIMLVTVSGQSWSAVRPQFGTTPASHNIGAVAIQCSVLTGGVSASGTSLALNNIGPFPSTDLPYYALIGVPGAFGTEVVQVTAVSGLTMTVVRGLGSTSHSANAPVTVWIPQLNAVATPNGYRQAILTPFNSSVPPSTTPWTDSGGAVLLVPVQDPFTAYTTPLLAQGRYYAVPLNQNALENLPVYEAQAYVPDNQLVVAGTPVAWNPVVPQSTDPTAPLWPTQAIWSGFGRTTQVTGPLGNTPGVIAISDSAFICGLDTQLSGFLPAQFATWEESPSSDGVWTPAFNSGDYVPNIVGESGLLNYWFINRQGLYYVGVTLQFSAGNGTVYQLAITDSSGNVINGAIARQYFTPGQPVFLSVAVPLYASTSLFAVGVMVFSDSTSFTIGPGVFWGMKLG